MLILNFTINHKEFFKLFSNNYQLFLYSYGIYLVYDLNFPRKIPIHYFYKNFRF